MMGDSLKETIQRFLARMQEQYVVKGAMLTGSYVSGAMMPNSDIDVAAKMLGKYPAYDKYAMAQLGEIDLTLAKCVEGLYAASSESDLLCEWKRLCRHVLRLLGDIDISDYQSITPITNKETV
jgi:predicted nucleotidyltransferase